MKYDVVIVGAGAGGITASAASIQKQDSSLSIALVDPAESHYYQPGWTLAGAGCMPHPERSGQWPRSYQTAW